MVLNAPEVELAQPLNSVRFDSKFEIVNSGWHHVAAAKAGDNLQLYIDGILDVQKDGMEKNPKWSVDKTDPIQISKKI